MSLPQKVFNYFRDPKAITASSTTLTLSANAVLCDISSSSGEQNVDIITRARTQSGDRLVFIGQSDSNYPTFRDSQATTNLRLRGTSRSVLDGDILVLMYTSDNLWTEEIYSSGTTGLTLSNGVTTMEPAGVDSATTTNLLELAFTSPVDTTGTNTHNALTIDIGIGNATGGTNTVTGVQIDGITADAQVTEYAINVGAGWPVGLRLPDSSTINLGTGDDITMAWDGTDFDILQATANSSFKWGIDGAGIDQVWYGDTASSNMTWDQSADAVILTNSKISLLSGAGAAASASGIVIGGGTSANPCTTSTADGKFVELRCETTAASGDNRLAYLRYAVGGAGGGECLRALTVLEAASGTVHGGHIGLFATDTGYITGLGVGARSTLELGNAALPAGGTYYGGQVEIYSDGASSSIAAVTKHAVLNIAATGDATGMATVLNSIAVDGTSAADTTKMISSVRLTELPAGNVGIAVLVNGTRYYIPCVPVAEWN